MDERIFLQVSQCLFKVVYGVHHEMVARNFKAYLPVSGLPQGHIGEKVHESFEDAHVAPASRRAYGLSAKHPYSSGSPCSKGCALHSLLTDYRMPVRNSVACATHNALPCRISFRCRHRSSGKWRYDSSAWCRSGTTLISFISASTGRSINRRKPNPRQFIGFRRAVRCRPAPRLHCPFRTCAFPVPRGRPR